MLVIQHTEHFRIESPTIVTIGTFDGIHLGHQKILARLNELKKQTGLKTVVLTFDPHPRKVLFPEQKDLKLLTGIDEKLELLKKYQVDVAVVYPFSKAFSQLTSEEYITHILKKSLHVKYLVIGYDHKFGLNRTGDIHTLRQYAADKSFEVEEISAKDIDSIAVSSSKIRKALEEGDVELAAEFLGYPYFMEATVVKGKQLGRTLGYPTANLMTHSVDKLIPARGVYFVAVNIGQTTYHGMMSIGLNPTTDSDLNTKLEVHVFEFNGDLYDQNLRVEFLKYLRPEKKFDSLEALKQALHEDQEKCYELLTAHS